MTYFYKLNKSTPKLIASAGALTLIAGMSLGVATPAFADGTADCNAGAGANSTECGIGASAGGDNSTVLGNGASAVGSTGTAVGKEANAFGLQSVAVGRKAFAGINAIALGDFSNAQNSQSVSVGQGTFAGTDSTALGTFAGAGNQSTALGRSANASGTGATAIGLSTQSAGTNAIAIGSDASGIGFGGTSAAGSDSIVIGTDASDGAFADAIVIGEGATATETNQVILKSADTFTILGNGDVGIGTATPGAKLEVNTGAADTKILLSNNSAVWEIKSNASNGKMTIGNNTTGAKPFKFGPDAIGNLLQVGIVATDQVDIKGNLVTTGTITTGGPTCGGGCDAVFDADYDLPSIEEHAKSMYARKYLPAVGPTVPHAPMNISEKMGDMLNELEKAHIYIAQQQARLKRQDAELAIIKQQIATFINQ